MFSVSSGGLAITKYTFAPQKKMTIVMRNGTTVQASSSMQPAVHLRAHLVGMPPAELDRRSRRRAWR